MHTGAIGRAVAITAITASFLTALPLISRAQDKKGKQAEQSMGDSAAINAAKKKYSDIALQRNSLVSFSPQFRQDIVFNPEGYVSVTNPENGNTIIKLSPGEQEKLIAAGMFKPLGRPYLIVLAGKEGAYRIYVIEVKQTEIPAAGSDSTKTSSN